MTFACKIELSGPAGGSTAEFQVDAAARAAIEWLMLAGQRDEIKSLCADSVTIENIGAEVIIRISKSKASEIAIARRFS